MTDTPHNETDSDATPMNLGQAMLLALGVSLTMIEAAARTTKSTAARWRKGTIPTATARKRLRAAYGIPFDAWDRVATPEALSEAMERASGHAAPKNRAREASGTAAISRRYARGPRERTQLHNVSAGYGAPDLPDAPPEGATPLEEIRFNYFCTMRELANPQLTDAMRSKLRNSAIRSLALIASLERGEELDSPRYVHEHPAFKRLIVQVTTALGPFPEALRSVSEALQTESM